MDLRGKKILVIGGAGLIGSHLVEKLLLEDISELIIYDNFCRGSEGNISRALKDPRCRIFEAGGDILQRDILNSSMKGVDGVFHLAALWLLQCHEFPRSAFEVNIKGTFNVLEACVDNHIKKLVYSSSASVYGNAVAEPMAEDHVYNNKTFYGATKIAGEHMCRSFHHRYGLNYSGLRYMNVYGPRQDYRGVYIAVIMKILDRIDQGKPPLVFGDGSQAYDFIQVKDCARANICAMKGEVYNSFYNVGTGIKTSIKELVEIILQITGVDLAIEYKPDGQTFVDNRIACTKKASRELKFISKIPLEEGLKDLIAWRKSHIEEVKKKRKATTS